MKAETTPPPTPGVADEEQLADDIDRANRLADEVWEAFAVPRPETLQ